MNSVYSFSAPDQRLTDSILDKIDAAKKDIEVRTISFETLYALLSEQEIRFVEKLNSLEPSEYGFMGEFIGLEDVPEDLVFIDGQTYQFKGQTVTIDRQFMPQHIYEKFVALNAAMKNDIGKELMISSCYRSPAYQLIVFLRNLRWNKYDFKRTVAGVALPGFSEHGSAEETAIDFRTQTYELENPEDFDFSETDEYDWLLDHAEEYNLFLSYPEDNDLGVVFEPWHWRYRNS